MRSGIVRIEKHGFNFADVRDLAKGSFFLDNYGDLYQSLGVFDKAETRVVRTSNGELTTLINKTMVRPVDVRINVYTRTSHGGGLADPLPK